MLRTRCRENLSVHVARAPKPARSGNLLANFHSSCRNLFDRAGSLREADLHYWIEDLKDTLDLGQRSGLISTNNDFLSHVLPAISAFARRHLVDPAHIKTLLSIAANAIPWHDPRFESPESIEAKLPVNDARQVTEILHAIASHLRHVDSKNFHAQVDLMTGLAIKQFPSAVDRRALEEALAPGRRSITRVTHDLQLREAYFAIRSTDDAVDFVRRWIAPDTRLAKEWYWSEILELVLRAELPSTPSVDQVGDYVHACASLIDAAAEALKKADDIVLLQVRLRERLAKIDSLDQGWPSSLFNARLHQTLLDFHANQVPIVFRETSSGTKRVRLDERFRSVVERAVRFHPTLDFANSCTPLLVQLGNSKLAEETRGIPGIVARAIADGKFDAAYILQHGFDQRLFLAFPAEQAELLMAINGRPSPKTKTLPSRGPAKDANGLPDVDLAFDKIRSAQTSAATRVEKDTIIVRELKKLCSDLVNFVDTSETADRQATRNIFDSRKAPLEEQFHYHTTIQPAVQRIVNYVDEQWMLSVKNKAEVLTSAMNAFNFCRAHEEAGKLYDRLRKHSLQDKLDGIWFSRAISIVRLSGLASLPPKVTPTTRRSAL